MKRADDRLVIAGGGLAGSLVALALAELRPEVPFLLVESGPSFGGNHVWSFFDPDVVAEDRWLVGPLIEARWEGYDVAFPHRRRTLQTAYNSVSSNRLDQLVRARLRADQYLLGTKIETIASDHVNLSDGVTLPAQGVIDARGPSNLSTLDVGWQKFLGREYHFDEPHGLDRPIIMDATVEQADGYRFVYCLPFSERRMLVEDTYYSLSPSLDTGILGRRLDSYVGARSWPGARVGREETGVLPVVMGGDVNKLWEHPSGVPRLGLRGGFFHPTTGYTFPDAVRTALLVTRQSDFSSRSLHRVLKQEAARLWRQRRFYRVLDRMLFHAAPPHQRYRMLEHFYRLDAALVARFYAAGSSYADKFRILTGKPPVPVGSAIRALLGLGRHSE